MIFALSLLVASGFAPSPGLAFNQASAKKPPLTDEMQEWNFPAEAEFDADFVPLIGEAWKAYQRSYRLGPKARLSEYCLKLGRARTFFRIFIAPRDVPPKPGHSVVLGGGNGMVFIFDGRSRKLLHRITFQ